MFGTDLFEGGSDMADQTSEAKKYLVFKLEEDEFGIEIGKISTIIEKGHGNHQSAKTAGISQGSDQSQR